MYSRTGKKESSRPPLACLPYPFYRRRYNNRRSYFLSKRVFGRRAYTSLYFKIHGGLCRSWSDFWLLSLWHKEGRETLNYYRHRTIKSDLESMKNEQDARFW